MIDHLNNEDMTSIAIVGMAGSFPKAKNIDEFWSNLKNGLNCITYYSEQELVDAHVERDILNHPHYVKAKGALEHIDQFDAHFFDMGPREAELMDPQHRLLLECAYHALEHAGYNPDLYPGLIGMYAGESMSSYAFLNVLPTIRTLLSTQSLQAAIGNDKDSLTTTIAYHLNLKGPAITIQTASSTSLVAISLACQQLLSYQCDLALAGGVSAGPPLISGYLYEEGGISSSDGKCRPFDEKSNGFVPGSGVGLVVLKRLSEAIRDRDHIWAIIKGCAINNDGNKKVSYSAPSVDAQAEAIAMAHEYANFDPETISYIEAHGTATNLGDPIEVAALTQAFRRKTDKKNFCALGSVKSNIGHLDTAAGVAGLIKTVLCLKHKTLVPTIHFEKANPALHLSSSPFYVSEKLLDWKYGDGPLRAGVTSLGMGGTNSHIVLEEARTNYSSPQLQLDESILLTLSAKTSSALSQQVLNLLAFLRKEDNISLVDVAYTLNIGRRAMKYRTSFVVSSKEELLMALENFLKKKDESHPVIRSPLLFLYFNEENSTCGWHKIYDTESLFKQAVNQCFAFLPKHKQEILFLASDPSTLSFVDWCLLSFILKYAFASFWIRLGVIPEGQLGEGIGGLVAAVIAEVMDLESALHLVQCRAENQIPSYLLRLSSPKILFISYRTNEWITEEEAKSSSYWNSLPLHSVQTNRSYPESVLGIGINQLSYCLRQGSFSPEDMSGKTLYKIMSKLFENGFLMNWPLFYKEKKCGRVALPLYPFERKKYWVESQSRQNPDGPIKSQLTSYQPRPQLATPYCPPTTFWEKKIVKIWEDELGLQPIGVLDDFFDLGGYSLVATSLLAIINDQFRTQISLREFYTHPTIKAIASKLETQSTHIDFESLIDEISSGIGS